MFLRQKCFVKVENLKLLDLIVNFKLFVILHSVLKTLKHTFRIISDFREVDFNVCFRIMEFNYSSALLYAILHAILIIIAGKGFGMNVKV